MKNVAIGEMQDNFPITLREGNILEGNFWPEPVQVIALKKIGRRYQIITENGWNGRYSKFCPKQSKK